MTDRTKFSPPNKSGAYLTEELVRTKLELDRVKREKMISDIYSLKNIACNRLVRFMQDEHMFGIHGLHIFEFNGLPNLQFSYQNHHAEIHMCCSTGVCT